MTSSKSGNQKIPAKPPVGLSKSVGRGLIIALAVILVCGGAAIFWVMRTKSLPLSQTIFSKPDVLINEMPDFESPFLNTKSNVNYVGDRGCSGCHSDIEKAYRQHPMGQSATTDWNDPSIRDLLKRDYKFTALDGRAEFETSLVDGKLIHKVSVLDSEGKPKAEQSAEATICIGSGSHARTFLCDKQSSLWESPITHFQRTDQWRLSPGYQMGLMFSRQVTKECLYCHVDRWEPIGRGSDIKNADFTGHASIGCERCHGPGDLHVKTHEGSVAVAASAEIDHTIVNPKHLEPVLQDSICQQCHLQGEARVTRPGKDQFDFRPGLPREQYWTVFVTRDWEKHLKVAGQVEQMVASECWKKSQGKLSCTSCHDPHRKPSEEVRVEFYRDKCNACHSDRDPCTVALVVRESKNANDCIQCHMPAREMDDISHASFHDHRVLRVPEDESENKEPILESIASGPNGLVPFHPTSYLPSPKALDRDRGIAMINVLAARGTGDLSLRDAIETNAYPLLAEALDKDPNDEVAALAVAKLLADRNPAASRYAAEAVLTKIPDSEGALSLAVYACALSQDWASARKYAEQIVAVVPSSPEGYQWLGNIAMQSQNALEAESWFRKAIERHAMSKESRVGLAAALFIQNKKTESNAEVQFVNELFPKQVPMFNILFQQLIEAASGARKPAR